jgi:hypothetical protein
MTTEPLPYRYPDLTWRHIAAELERELAHRLNFYRRQVDKSAMTDAEARHQIALFEALAEDCARFERAHASAPMVNPLTIPAKHRFSWRERHDALLRELGLRERLYPQWIDKGTLLQADADDRRRRLEALLALYEDGLDCPPADWPDAAAAIQARLHPAEQQALAL